MEPLFTVFTPTFNRCHTLNRVYGSLCAQTLREFEWLIVDDGSTDDTGALVAQWCKEADFPIRYFTQHNQGKHVAYNRGLELAQGRFFLTFDSDDTCTPDTLERFARHWNSIPEADRQSFSGVTVLCRDESGSVIGDRFPCEPLDCHPAELLARYHVRGEKWGFHRTEVAREFPFPVIDGERFVSEGLVWNRIGRRYKVRCVNDCLRVYVTTDGGLQSSIRHLRRNNPRSARLYYQEVLADSWPPLWTARHLLNYVRFSFHAGLPLGEILTGCGRPLGTLLALAPGALLTFLDRRTPAQPPEELRAPYTAPVRKCSG